MFYLVVSSSRAAMPFSLTSGIRPIRKRVFDVAFRNTPLLIVGGNGILGFSVPTTNLIFRFAESHVNQLGLNVTSAFWAASATRVSAAKRSGDLWYE